MVDAASGAEDAYAIQVDRTPCPPPQFSDLIISEYIEGGSFRKGVEVFNGTGGPMSLAGYSLMQGVNGGSLGSGYSLGDHELAPGATWVVCYDNGGSGDLVGAGVACDEVTSAGAVNFNGNDAVALANSSGTVVDIIGVEGEDPVSGWAVGTGSTRDHTLVRRPSVTAPAATWDASEWEVYPQDTVDDLGSHVVVDEQCPALGTTIASTAIDSDSTNGPSETNISCMDGYAAVGIYGQADVNADAIGLDCQPLFLMSSFFGLDPDPTLTIGTGGIEVGPFSCAQGQGLVGLQASYADPFHVFVGRCLPLADIAVAVAWKVGDDTTLGAVEGSADTSGDTETAVMCPNGSIVTGLSGYRESGGDGVSRVALSCRSFPHSVCGFCGAGTVCNEVLESCVSTSGTGNSCETATALSLGAPAAGNLKFQGSVYDYTAPDCKGQAAGFGVDMQDEVWTFTPSISGTYTVTVAPNAFDAQVAVTASCSNMRQECLGGWDDAGVGGTEVLNLELGAGVTYYVIVDNGTGVGDTTYTITVSD